MSIIPVIPRHNVDPLLDKEIKPKSIGTVNHMVIVKRIRVTNENRGLLQIVKLEVLILRGRELFPATEDLLRSGREEHAVDVDVVVGTRLDEKMTAVEVFNQHMTHLVDCPEDRFKAETTGGPLTAAFHWVNSSIYLFFKS
jgi:hypothetical protein